MPKHKYTVSPTNVISPVKDKEVTLFCAAVNSPVTQALLKSLNVAIPGTIEITHNTCGDDPPDIEALGLGWECTEFPPNQSALDMVHEEMKDTAMIVPGYSQTGSNVGKIREPAMPYSAYPKPWAVNVADSRLLPIQCNRHRERCPARESFNSSLSDGAEKIGIHPVSHNLINPMRRILRNGKGPGEESPGPVLASPICAMGC